MELRVVHIPHGFSRSDHHVDEVVLPVSAGLQNAPGAFLAVAAGGRCRRNGRLQNGVKQLAESLIQGFDELAGAGVGVVIAAKARLTRDFDKFMLRLPDGMRDVIKYAAEENGRSMNAEIVDRLDKSISAENEMAGLVTAFEQATMRARRAEEDNLQLRRRARAAVYLQGMLDALCYHSPEFAEVMKRRGYEPGITSIDDLFPDVRAPEVPPELPQRSGEEDK